ncbi:MAG TPA: hypothetical protein VMR77_01545 [Patescibacteria group bacterium]|nr:hypothetical protein [Patescibacteria group bacterium]
MPEKSAHGHTEEDYVVRYSGPIGPAVLRADLDSDAQVHGGGLDMQVSERALTEVLFHASGPEASVEERRGLATLLAEVVIQTNRHFPPRE